jgi:hypothetical protein
MRPARRGRPRAPPRFLGPRAPVLPGGRARAPGPEGRRGGGLRLSSPGPPEPGPSSRPSGVRLPACRWQSCTRVRRYPQPYGHLSALAGAMGCFNVVAVGPTLPGAAGAAAGRPTHPGWRVRVPRAAGSVSVLIPMESRGFLGDACKGVMPVVCARVPAVEHAVLDQRASRRDCPRALGGAVLEPGALGQSLVTGEHDRARRSKSTAAWPGRTGPWARSGRCRHRT